VRLRSTGRLVLIYSVYLSISVEEDFPIKTLIEFENAHLRHLFFQQ